MVNGIPTSFLLDTRAAVTLMRKDEWDHVSLGTELEPWGEHNLVSIDGTPLLNCGHATVDLSLGEQTYSVDIVVVGTLTTMAILDIDFLMKYNDIVDVGMAQLILSKAGPLELHQGSRQMQYIGVLDRCKNQLVYILRKALGYPFSEQMVLATVQGSVPGGPYMLECNEEKRLPCVVA